MALSPQTLKPNYTTTNNINHAKTGEPEEDEEAERGLQEQQQGEEEIDTGGGSPKRYVPLCDLYSATSPCVNGGIMSKKVKARKMTTTPKTETLTLPSHHIDHEHEEPPRPPVIKVYTRRRRPKRPRVTHDSLVVVKEELEEEDADKSAQPKKKQKKSNEKKGKQRALVDSTPVSLRTRKSGPSSGKLPSLNRSPMVYSAVKRWVRLGFGSADSNNFIGLKCKVYWPLDDDWYIGRVVRYNADTGRHHVSYEDGDEEDINIRSECIKFYISRDEMRRLNLSYKIGTSDTNGLEFSEMVVLAASFDDCHELGPGDIIWAKIAGHAMWPAVVVDESCLGNRKGLSKNSEGKSVPVQFFGTHDFARVNTKQIISFLKGLLSSFHLKCKKPNFVQSLEEAKLYLCEQKLPRRMIRMQNGMEADDCDSASQEDENNADSGEECKMESLNSKLFSKSSSSKVASQRSQDLPGGYRPVHVKWKDLDKCNVCHMDEEYENNLFLQCDKCRMMVHAKCYGELEPVDGVLWLCNLCRPGAPNIPPPCCLCPLIGGAMKPTTDGRWAHLACAIWIPETCLSDIKKMEPIDGLSRINKDRWKLLCSICGVSYGACIQCSNNTCRVAYHPLCARAAGFCAELEDEDKLHLISMDEDEDEQCIRLLSFCKKHRPLSNERLEKDDRVRQTERRCSDYSPPFNPSGCARSEPYNYFGRRGRKEPEAPAASLKRLFVENRPYLVGGSCQHEAMGYTVSSTSGLAGSKFSFSLQKLKSSQLDASKTIHSMAEKYRYMRETFRKRLAFGKSGIHGFGIFAKQLHRAGDMVIEYTGELVRPPIADRREHLIYNSLVGAGTYLFRIDDERVIDATRAGSIAHLINHSCEPNCYSRVISVNGDEHIIIFAKRDIKQWEELTYDYRFFSIDEQLACYCGFPRCRGVVNDIDAEEQLAKLYVSRSELRDWRGE